MTSSTNYYFAEGLGTMVFVLAILCVANREEDDTKIVSGSVPIYIGLALIVSIYLAQGLGSDGELNPAVTIARCANGNVTASDMCIRILAQIVGALLAYGVYKLVPASKSV